MTKSVPIRKNDGSGQLDGSIGNGKVDVPTPNPSGNLSLTTLTESTSKDPVELAKEKFDAIRQEKKNNGYQTKLFERFSFAPEVVQATKDLLSKHPSKLSTEEKVLAYQSWVDALSQNYGIESLEVVFQEEMGRTAYFNYDTKTYRDLDKPVLKVHSNDATVAALLQAYRKFILDMGVGEPKFNYYNDSHAHITLVCQECSGKLDSNYWCPSCGFQMAESMAQNEYNDDFDPDEENLSIDRIAWFSSLYYQADPAQLESLALEGRTNRTLSHEFRRKIFGKTIVSKAEIADYQASKTN